MDLIDSKKTLDDVDFHIRELEERLRILKRSRNQLAVGMCEYVLNSAPACDRDCCGATPRQLFMSVSPCDKSPIGTCVFSQLKDPAHDNCLFCHTSEYSGG